MGGTQGAGGGGQAEPLTAGEEASFHHERWQQTDECWQQTEEHKHQTDSMYTLWGSNLNHSNGAGVS
jgi:hypothetical protein